MNANINIYPVLATWKQGKKDGKCPIHLSVDLNGKRAAFPSLKRKILPEHWDTENKSEPVRKNCPNSAILNALIRKRIKELDADYMKMQLLDAPINRTALKKKAKGVNTGADYIKFCRQHIEEKYKNPDTKRSYESELTKLEKFQAVVHFSDLNFEFLQKYQKYMRDTLKNEDNTVWKTFKFHNTMLIDAIKIGGFIKANPFNEFDRGRYKQGIPTYLEWHEFQAYKKKVIAQLAYLGEYDKRVALRFMLSCCSGLRFGDVCRFSYETFVIKDSNGERLILSAKKNEEIVSIAFTKDIALIVGLLKGDDRLKTTTQEYNRSLKVTGGMAGIKKNLTSHVGRHTFGMRCAELGMSIDETQKLMGHRDRDSTAIYYRIKNARLDDAMKAWDRAPKKKSNK